MNRNRGFPYSLFSFSLSPCLLVPLSPCLLVSLSLYLADCSRPVTEAEKRAAVDEFFTQARSCWPNDGESSAPLAVESVVSEDRKSTRLNSSHVRISYAVFCLKKK